MQPSTTTRGQRWLENFAASDQSTARLLIDSLQIVSVSDVHTSLKSQITRLTDEVDTAGGTALLLPVLSIEDIESALTTRTALTQDQRALSLQSPQAGQSDPIRHVAWQTYPPGQPIPVTPGSEGAVGNLIRDFAGGAPGAGEPPWLHPGSSLEDLRVQRCRRIVLVTDYSGSGTQIVNFAKTLTRNATIRSWRSYGWLRIVVIAHALSGSARQHIEDSGAVDELRSTIRAASLEDAAWTEAERHAVEQLCQHYAARPKYALGYKQSAGLYLSHGSIPNNLPDVLLRSGPSWRPLFDGQNGRVFPPDLASELGAYAPPGRDLADVARQSGREQLARAIESRRFAPAADRLAVALALIDHEGGDASQLALALQVDEPTARELLNFLVALELLTPDLRLTRTGRAELNASQRLQRLATAGLIGSEDPYYPQALR